MPESDPRKALTSNTMFVAARCNAYPAIGSVKELGVAPCPCAAS